VQFVLAFDAGAGTLVAPSFDIFAMPSSSEAEAPTPRREQFNLRDNAFEPKLGGLKELGPITIDMVAELDGRAWVGLDQLPQRRPPLDEWDPPQILAVQVLEVPFARFWPQFWSAAGATVIWSVAVRNEWLKGQGHLYLVVLYVNRCPCSQRPRKVAATPCGGRGENCMSTPFWTLTLIGLVQLNADRPSLDTRLIVTGQCS
jgi:hypothetical protein